MPDIDYEEEIVETETISPQEARSLRPGPVDYSFEEVVDEDYEEPVEPATLNDLPGYMKYMWMQDRANKERSQIWQHEAMGEIDSVDARNEVASSQARWEIASGPYKELSLREHPIKGSIGLATGLVPYMIDSQVEGATYSAIGGMIGGGIAAIIGQAGPQALIPEEIITVPAFTAAGMTVGYGYGVVKNILDREAYGLYGDMREKDVDKEIALPFALAGGLVIAALEYCQFKTLSKPLRMAYGRVMGTSVVKSGLKKALNNYAAQVGINIGQEELQSIAGLASKTIAGMLAKNPDAIPTKEEWWAELRDTAVKAGVGFAVLGLPGAVVDISVGRGRDIKATKLKEGRKLDKAINELNERQKAKALLTEDEQRILESAIQKKERGEDLEAKEQEVMDFFDKVKQEKPKGETPTEGGKVIKAYHGTNKQFDAFEPTAGVRSNWLGGTVKAKSPVFFFSKDKKVAKSFAKDRVLESGGKARVVEADLTMNNTLDMTVDLKTIEKIFNDAGVNLRKIYGEEPLMGTLNVDRDQMWELFDKPEIVDALKKAGYDSAIIDEVGEDGADFQTYVIFDAKQIKTSSKLSPTEGGKVMYHGTSAKGDFASFKGDVVYLAQDAKEADAFAKNPILGGGRGEGIPRVLKVDIPEGKSKDINAIVEDTIMNDGDLDVVVSEQAKIARKEGYDYLTFNHPSSVEGVDEFQATVAINPSKLKLSPTEGKAEKPTLDDRMAKVEEARQELEAGGEVERYLLDNKVRKYSDDLLKEELSALNRKYVTTNQNANTIDQTLDELRSLGYDFANEYELTEYLKNWENRKQDLKETIEANKARKVTKYETTVLKEKLKNIERGIREGKKLAKDEAKSIQADIAKLIEDADIEAKDKAKFLRSIKNIQTQQQFEKALPDLIKRITKIEQAIVRKEAVEGIKKILDRKESKSLPVEYKDIFDKVAEAVGLKKRSAKTLKMRAFVERMKESGEEITIPDEQLDLLAKNSVDDFTTEELEDLQEVLERIYHKGTLKNKLIAQKESRDFDKSKQDIINTITTGKGVTEDSPIVKILREQNKGFKDKSLDAIKNFIVENLRPELMILMLDDMNTDGPLNNLLFKPLWEAEKSRMTEGGKTLDIIKEIHQDLAIAEIMSKKYQIGRFKGMTKDNALFIYANSFNENNRAHLIASGITEADIKDITDFLSDEEKTAVSDMLKFYDQYQYPTIDEVFAELEGIHLGKEENYFPIDRLEDISYLKELTQNLLEKKGFQRTGVAKGFTKQRVDSSKGYSQLSYFDTVMRNYTKVEHYKAYAAAIRDATKILNNSEIRNAIEEKQGKKYYQVLEKWLKDVASNGDKTALDRLAKFSRWVRTNYVSAVLGLNIVTMMKQPISFMQGAEMAGKRSTMQALAKFMTDPFKWNDWVDSKSILIKNRPFSQEREMREILSRRGAAGTIGGINVRQAIREKSLMPIVIADKVTCNIVWMGAYEAAISDGKLEDQAIDFADSVIRRTQPMSGTLNLPDTFRGGEVQKLFTTFRNQPNQNFNLLYQTFVEGTGRKISKAQFASHLAFYVIVPSLLIGLISRRRLPEEPKEFILDLLNGALGGVFLIGNVIGSMASGYGLRGTDTPLDAIYRDFGAIFTAKDREKQITNLAKFLGKMYGLPIVGISRLIKGEPFGATKKEKSLNII